MERKSKRFALGVIFGFAGVVLVIVLIMVTVDPYFHYHAPVLGIKHTLYDERYQNDGILKNFKYDTIITGSSLAENFKTSTCDSLFGGTSVKVPFAGGSYREVNDTLERAFRANPGIKRVIRCLDYDRLFNDKDLVEYDLNSYPDYLYDDKLLNDVKYIFNKTIFFVALEDLLGRTGEGKIEFSFDKYMNQESTYEFGKAAALDSYARYSLEPVEEFKSLSEEDKAVIDGNIEQNVLSLVTAHPETEFYFYFGFDNILFMDLRYRNGELFRYLEAEEYIARKLVQYPNVHLSSFYMDMEGLMNIAAYHDIAHYDSSTCDLILKRLHAGEYELSKENIDSFYLAEKAFYSELDFDEVYKKLTEE